MDTRDLHATVRMHLEGFFAGHDTEYFTWELGPIRDALPHFRVGRFAPGPRFNLWVYASVGASSILHEESGQLEFVLVCPHETPRAVELLSMIAHRHVSDPLGKWHLMPIGQPWLDGSSCDVLFISPPYPFGPGFEVCDSTHSHLHFLWLLPITQLERDYCRRHGASRLEDAFEQAGLEYWRVDRESVV